MKLLYTGIAIVGLAVAGWLGYQAQRGGAQPGASADPAKIGSTGGPVAGAGSGQDAPKSSPGSGASGGPSGGTAGARGPGGPAAVEVAKATNVPMTEEVVATGALRARESVMLRPEVAGRVASIGFTDGSRVKKGAVLLALDASLSQAELEQVKAEKALAQANFQRTSELASRNFVSERAKDEAAANLKVVDARLQLAQARLARSQVRAPFDGVMGLRNVSPGDYLREGSDIGLLEDTSRMRVDLRLPERIVGRISKGQRITVRFDALPDKDFEAQIEALDSTVEANGRSVLARGTVANPTGVLKTGMFARAQVVLSSRPNAIVVPEEAVVPIGSDSFVYKVVDNKAQRVKIKLGLRRDGKVEVVEGIALDDQVVTAGQIRLRGEGGDVRIVDPNRPRGQGGPGAPKAEGPKVEGSKVEGPKGDGTKLDGPKVEDQAAKGKGS